MAYKSWGALENAILEKIRIATKDCQEWAFNRLEENLERFYDTPEPEQYERTDHLKHSGKQGVFLDTSEGAYGIISIDERPFYITGTYETPWVFENAELGYKPSNMLGNPLFWGDTMRDLENDFIPNSFGRFFKKSGSKRGGF